MMKVPPTQVAEWIKNSYGHLVIWCLVCIKILVDCLVDIDVDIDIDIYVCITIKKVDQ